MPKTLLSTNKRLNRIDHMPKLLAHPFGNFLDLFYLYRSER
jgi:hypothetical protein